MGFNLLQKQEQANITINNLTSQMMIDLIACYGADIPSSDVESRYLLAERAGVKPKYPIISKDVVEEFYQQLDMVKGCIKDVIIGNIIK